MNIYNYKSLLSKSKIIEIKTEKEINKKIKIKEK